MNEPFLDLAIKLEILSDSEVDYEVKDIITFSSDKFELKLNDDIANILVIEDLETIQRKRGIGSKIVHEVLNYSNNSNYKTIIAKSIRDKAYGFWQKMGFEINGNNGYYRF